VATRKHHTPAATAAVLGVTGAMLRATYSACRIDSVAGYWIAVLKDESGHKVSC